MWPQFLVLALFLSLPLEGHPAKLKISLADKSEDDLVALMHDISKLLGVSNGSSPGPIDKEVTFSCKNRTSGTFHRVLLNDAKVYRKIDFKKPIAFIIHGWNSTVKQPQFLDMARNYSRFVDSNVCLLDWSNLSSYDYEIAARHSLKMVVAYFSRFLRFLNLNGMSYDRVTLIGHSLGAQISGFVGKNFNGSIGQIFALDPAGVLFTLPDDVGEKNRLAPTDARYVQAIYTSRGDLSMDVSAGQQNFWVNDNGAHPQPGCKDVGKGKGMLTQYFESLVCSHRMAIVYFTAAIDPAVSFTMKRCSAYWMYNTGLCYFGKKDVLGIHAKRITGDFYGSIVLPYPYRS
ncbi:lipase member H-like [Topomyia yanbarensis]|uniref:lipase member H-like n=1 Tax=Topomyia yanbarensis TaxID=2498891 RepID=UPI00273B8510|nr:lipase member H-like [Topomyia yanbarensis]